MTRKTPFFITAALLFAALTLALPDLELEAAAEEPVKGATIRRAWPARPRRRPRRSRSHDRTTGHLGRSGRCHS